MRKEFLCVILAIGLLLICGCRTSGKAINLPQSDPVFDVEDAMFDDDTTIDTTSFTVRALNVADRSGKGIKDVKFYICKDGSASVSSYAEYPPGGNFKQCSSSWVLVCTATSVPYICQYTGLVPGKTYDFAVNVQDNAGNIEYWVDEDNNWYDNMYISPTAINFDPSFVMDDIIKDNGYLNTVSPTIKLSNVGDRSNKGIKQAQFYYCEGATAEVTTYGEFTPGTPTGAYTTCATGWKLACTDTTVPYECTYSGLIANMKYDFAVNLEDNSGNIEYWLDENDNWIDDVTVCDDECRPDGLKACSANNGYQTCGYYGADTCLDWSPVTACPIGTACADGICLGTCTVTSCPDLRIISVTYSPDPMVAGRYSSYQIRVDLTGTQQISSEIALLFDGNEIKRIPANNLKPNQINTVTGNTTMPSAGQFEMTLYIDPDNLISETSEANNQYAFVLRVVCNPDDCDADGYKAVSAGGEDCNDNDKNIHPGAQEKCGDMIDSDCTGTYDDPGAVGCVNLYKDADKDYYGVSNDYMCLCAGTSGNYRAINRGDCNDNNPAVNPGATESCSTASGYDAIDNNCDGLIDLNCAVCRDMICQQTETYITCPSDCPSYTCGNNVCEQTESHLICPHDCP